MATVSALTGHALSSMNAWGEWALDSPSYSKGHEVYQMRTPTMWPHLALISPLKTQLSLSHWRWCLSLWIGVLEYYEQVTESNGCSPAFSKFLPGTETYGKYHNRHFHLENMHFKRGRRPELRERLEKMSTLYAFIIWNLSFGHLIFFLLFILSSFSALLSCGVGEGVNSV